MTYVEAWSLIVSATVQTKQRMYVRNVHGVKCILKLSNYNTVGAIWGWASKCGIVTSGFHQVIQYNFWETGSFE